ncbi:hypothetical protein [Nodularia chucula]|uniref:hypothetical protein n=1 Tax=Nodularia chucula TaxID=3093667 RepID=UPI0039C7600F
MTTRLFGQNCADIPIVDSYSMLHLRSGEIGLMLLLEYMSSSIPKDGEKRR